MQKPGPKFSAPKKVEAKGCVTATSGMTNPPPPPKQPKKVEVTAQKK